MSCGLAVESFNQQVVVGKDHGLGFSGTDFFPLVFPKVAALRELQFRGLRRLVDTLRPLELWKGLRCRRCSAGWKMSLVATRRPFMKTPKEPVSTVWPAGFLFFLARLRHRSGEQQAATKRPIPALFSPSRSHSYPSPRLLIASAATFSTSLPPVSMRSPAFM